MAVIITFAITACCWVTTTVTHYIRYYIRYGRLMKVSPISPLFSGTYARFGG